MAGRPKKGSDIDLANKKKERKVSEDNQKVRVQLDKFLKPGLHILYCFDLITLVTY